MTATDELRALLDDAGVEWWQSVNMLGCIFTRWYSPLFGDEVVAMENGEGELELFSHLLTPAQAVEATLGRGECHNTHEDDGYFRCSECGGKMHGWTEDDDAIWFSKPRFCPNCGRRVMEVD